MSNSFYWIPMPVWTASASEILNEEASEESGQSTDSLFMPPMIWAAGAHESLNEQVSEKSGQYTDDF